MTKILTQFSHIFIHYYSNKSSSTSKLFISEPNKLLEDKMGRLFGILEINTPSRENSQIIAQLIGSLEDNYYNQIENENFDIEKAFENALEETNKEFVKMLQEKKFYLVGNLNEQTIKEKINLAVGLIKNDQLLISYLNNAGAFLIHKTKQDYKLIDIKKISKGENNTKKEEESNKLFTNLLQGQLNPPDYLCVANNNFLNYVSLERIQKTITSLPIHKAAEYFKNSLLQHEGYNFAAIIIKNTKEEQTKTPESASLTSITELNYTESSTERLLSPSFWTGFKKIINHIINLFQKGKQLQKKENELSMESPETDSLAAESIENQTEIENQAEPEKMTKYPSGILIGWQKFYGRIKRTTKNFFTKNTVILDNLQKIKNYLRLKLAYLGTYLKKIPNLSKILLIIGILLIILFIYSTSYFKHQQNEAIDSQAFQNSTNQIEEKINLAESDIIFGDETKAREEISQAQELLDSLVVNSQKQKEKQGELSSSIEAVIAKLRHITNITEPTLIADLSTEQDNNINIQNIIYQNNSILAFDSINNNSYEINLDTREINKIYSNLSDIGKIIKAKNVGNQILVYHDKNGFVQFKDNKFVPLNIGLQSNGQIIDFASYSGRLYTVDIKNNQIYRYQPIDNGYANGLAWLKEANFDLKNINSIGIDTNIWLLSNDGQIFKFNKGLKRDFTVKNLEPALESPTAFFTNDETNFLYILEPVNKRIVVLDKEGNLVTQYYSEAFDNLKSFEIIESEKKIFVVNDNKILFFNLTNI